MARAAASGLNRADRFAPPPRGASRAAGTRADRQVPPRSDRSLGLERLHVRGSRALGALLRVVADLRALGKRLEAVALDRAVEYEQVLAGVIGCDEAKALVVAEPLHSPCGHVYSLRVCALRTAEDAENATTAETRGTALVERKARPLRRV